MRTESILFALTLAVIGCSVPDNADISELENEIRAMPPPEFGFLSKWVFERVIDRYMYDHGSDDVADILCGKDGDVTHHTTPILDEWYTCLKGEAGYIKPLNPWSAAGWANCTEQIRSQFERDGDNCVLLFKPRFSWEEIVDRAAAENQDQINRAWVSLMVTTIIASPIAPPSIGRLLPVLCGLSVSWSCPGAPGYPGNTPILVPQPAPGGDTP